MILHSLGGPSANTKVLIGGRLRIRARGDRGQKRRSETETAKEAGLLALQVGEGPGAKECSL